MMKTLYLMEIKYWYKKANNTNLLTIFSPGFSSFKLINTMEDLPC